MAKNYLVLDFETTGLDRHIEQVTEVGLIKYDENFNEVAHFHTYVKLRIEHGLSDFIKNLTGITEEKLSYGISEGDAMDIIGYLIDEETVVVAQYAPFDFGYLANYGIYPERYLCTKTLTNLVEPDEKSSLGVTCERNGIVLNDAHTAMGDVQATAELLQLRLKQGFGIYENYVTEQPDRPLTFTPEFTIEVISI